MCVGQHPACNTAYIKTMCVMAAKGQSRGERIGYESNDENSEYKHVGLDGMRVHVASPRTHRHSPSKQEKYLCAILQIANREQDKERARALP